MGAIMQMISERTRAELQKRVPGLSPDEFEHWLSIYRFESQQDEATPADARRLLDRMAGLSLTLSAAIAEAMQDEGVWHYLQNECAAYGEFGFAVRLRNELSKFGGVAEMARRKADNQSGAGRNLGSRTRFIHSLARAIERAGMAPDARPTGPLVVAFDIALQETGQSLADIPGIVRSALKSRKE